MSEDKTTLTERKALPHLTWMQYLKELERENPQSVHVRPLSQAGQDEEISYAKE